jgi:hypothetical protein
VVKRKTAAFSIISAEHQRLALEAFQDKYDREPLKWKRSRLSRLMRNLSKALQVSERKERARK